MYEILIEQAQNIQTQLSKKVIKTDQLPTTIKHIAGVDVAYEKGGNRVIAALAILNTEDLKIVEVSSVIDTVKFPYISGLFSFRELPPILKAFEKLKIIPDLVVCDGQGYAHPRRFGLACHLGVELDIPTFGCAKKRLIGGYNMPDEERGSFSYLIDKGEIIGRAVRTQNKTKPIFISIGHRISLETAAGWLLKLCPQYRLPETTRAADHYVNEKMKEIIGQSKL